jgi:hypothetical protein
MPAGPRGDLKRAAKIGAARLLLIAPAFISFNYIFRFAVDVPYWDAWQFVPLLGEFYEGKLPLGLLTQQHNEHRIVLPRILMLFLARLTHYDTRAEMYASWLMLCAIVVVYFLVHARSFGTSFSSVAAFVPIPWVVLTLRQHENLLWGWQIQVALAALLLVVTLFFIETSLLRQWRFVLALLTAAGCTFSFGIGLVVWPTALLQLLLLARRGISPRRRNLALGAWILGGTCCLALYFLGYRAPSGHPPFLRPLQDPRAFFAALCAVLGNPFTSNAMLAPVLGAVVLASLTAVLLIAARGRLDLQRAPLAIPLIASSLFAALLVVIGRGRFGIPELTISRYVTLVVPSFVGAHMATLAIRDRRSRLFLGIVGFSLVAMAVFASFDGTYSAGRERRAIMLAYRRTLLDYRSVPDSDLTGLFADPLLVRRGAGVLQTHQLSAFRSAPQK